MGNLERRNYMQIELKGSVENEAALHGKMTDTQLADIAKKPFGNWCSPEFAEFAQFAAHIPPRSRVVEFGCADGWLLGLLEQMGHECVGVDCNKAWLDQCNAKWPKVKTIQSDWEHCGCTGYDVVIWNGSLHHSLDFKSAMSCSYRALRPGGLLLASEPGIGHSLRPSTRAWHRQTGATERDTPPIKTVAYGLTVGFRKPKVFPALNTLVRVNKLRLCGLLSLALILGRWGHGFVVMQKPLERKTK